LSQLIRMVVSFAKRADAIVSTESQQVILSFRTGIQRSVTRDFDSTKLLYQECNGSDASNMLRRRHGVPNVFEKHFRNFTHDDIFDTDWIIALQTPC
jgi:hypothetical protein